MTYTDDNIKFYKKLWDAGLDSNPDANPSIDDLQAYLDAGVMSKDDLVDGAYYQGDGRASDFAMWDAKSNCFWYMSTANPGTPIKTDVPHMADSKGFDFFMPFQKLDDKDVRDGDRIK